jgi:hypothetical protein
METSLLRLLPFSFRFFSSISPATELVSDQRDAAASGGDSNPESGES